MSPIRPYSGALAIFDEDDLLLFRSPTAAGPFDGEIRQVSVSSIHRVILRSKELIRACVQQYGWADWLMSSERSSQMTKARVQARRTSVWLVVSSLELLLGVGSVTGCFDPCLRFPQRAIAAPDSRYVAATFKRSCGATTAMTYFVGVAKDSSSAMRESATVFRFRLPHDEQYDSLRRPIPYEELARVTLDWLSATTLRIGFNQRVEIMIQKFERSGVDIEFVKR